jgi:hypothetical protein
MHPDEEMQGSWLFPDDPAEAKGWDDLGAYGLNDWERTQAIAWQRIYDAARGLMPGST